MNIDLLCECRNGSCMERISVPWDVVEAKFGPEYAFVKPEHVEPSERVVKQGDGWAMVDTCLRELTGLA